MTDDHSPRVEDIDLDEWLLTLEEDDDPVHSFAFPNERVRAAYLDSVPARTAAEVRELLRHLLMRSGELGSDETQAAWLKHLFLEAPEKFGEAMNVEYYRRLVGVDDEPSWQGLSWVLDLLPRWPKKAIEVLEAYFLAHMMHLPDGRIWGISDAQAIIRAMWIGNTTSGAEKLGLVLQLGPERFEHLVESLYFAMGFATTITPRSHDGGRDIEAVRTAPGASERTLIECKLWTKPVGVIVVRRLLGVVAHERSTKGVLVSTDSFTKPARTLAASDHRLELLGWVEILSLLDEHLGADWGRNVDRFIAQSLSRKASQLTS